MIPDMTTMPSKIGYHYFPDSEHYGRTDLSRWLPVITSLQAKYLTLLAPTYRAIPEFFIQELIEHSIEPILHLPMPVGNHHNQSSLDLILKSYANWGIRYVVLFDRPNVRSAWMKTEWNQANLTSHFLDHFLPLAEKVIGFGLVPVFPPLEPGGDYWDTSFLRSSLIGMLTRRKTNLLENMVLGTYGYVNETGWNWGRGGPDRWPESRPYSFPTESEDHRGFFIHQWYSEIARAVTGIDIPTIQLRVGRTSKPLVNFTLHSDVKDFYRIYKYLSCANKSEPKQATQSDFLLANCFWLLSAEQTSHFNRAALFSSDGQPSLSAQMLLRILQEEPGAHFLESKFSISNEETLQISAFPLPLYVLLPKNITNLSKPWLNDVHSLFPEKRIPMGNSPLDASLARKVFLAGNPSEYSDTQLQFIQKAGCELVACSDSGIEIAQFLAAI